MEYKNKIAYFSDFQPRAFSMMIKPVGAKCNLSCQYCYYLENEILLNQANGLMSLETLELFTKQFLENTTSFPRNIVWHGGEPCMAGLDFYRKAIEFQRKYAPNLHIDNSFQTNGLLINEEWCRFFADNNFLVGISIDGPEFAHNSFRYGKNKKGSFTRVLKAIELFHRFGVEFNTISTVNSVNQAFPMQVYDFLKSIGSVFHQYIPVVELDKSGRVTDWSVKPLEYANFIIEIFEYWRKFDVGNIFVQLFDELLAKYVNYPANLCWFSPQCGAAGVLEYNGDVYSCDYYVNNTNKLGNINQISLTKLMNTFQQLDFGRKKYTQLSSKCLSCKYVEICCGECPKRRFVYENNDMYGTNYLCQSYIAIIEHTKPYMEFMAKEIQAGRPAAGLMQAFLKN